MFSGQDIKGADKSFNNLKQSYQIAILAKERFFSDGEFFHTFEYYDHARGVSLKGRSRIITLELSKLENIAKKPAGQMSNPERWAFYFEYLTDRSKRSTINEILDCEEGIAMASSVLMTVSNDEEERARIMRDEKIELDYQSEMAYMRKLISEHLLEKIFAESDMQFSREKTQEIIQKKLYEYLPEEVCFRMLKMLNRGKSLEEILGNGIGGILENQVAGHVKSHAQGQQEIINLLKSGKSPEEIIKSFDLTNSE